MKWVRPLISIMFTLALIWGFANKLISSDIFVPIASGVIAWWFYQRNQDKKSPPPGGDQP